MTDPVHPHARGEHWSLMIPACAPVGSSPRAWGTRRAGSSRASGRTVHPHARGEHDERSRFASPVSGSSPRAWGTQEGRHLGRHILRFIPTRVGNTFSAARSPITVPVHPHARGEHGVGGRPRSPLCGSSPRAWGTQNCHFLGCGRFRFIPTRVGNTEAVTAARHAAAVHPHARGEHSLRRLPANRCVRFIPTRVGNTLHRAQGRLLQAVHPHARGEHLIHLFRGDFLSGSSPRAWGTPRINQRQNCHFRFIPTRVGNTRRGRLPTIVSTVHPHARGEHQFFRGAPGTESGSSPRAWGTREQGDRGK